MIVVPVTHHTEVPALDGMLAGRVASEHGDPLVTVAAVGGAVR